MTNKRIKQNRGQAEHGGNLRDFAERFHIGQDKIIDFSSNINPLGLASSVASIYHESLYEITRYPDPSARDLCQEIAHQYDLKPANVIAGNGSMPLLELAIRTIRPRRALIVEPCFVEYRRLLEMVGAQIDNITLSEKNAFRFSLSQIERAMNGIDMVILGHPNNPTGTAFERSELLSLITSAKKRGIFFLIDEAFCDWCPDLSVAQEAEKNSILIVTRSLTKLFCLAGIRAGFALGPKKLIERMRVLQETWSCNALAQRLSITALRDSEYRDRCLLWFRTESTYLFKGFSGIPEIKVYPSNANFFLIKLKDREKHYSFIEALTMKGIYLRECQGFQGLGKAFFRIALRLREENNLLLQISSDALSPQEIHTEKVSC